MKKNIQWRMIFVLCMGVLLLLFSTQAQSFANDPTPGKVNNSRTIVDSINNHLDTKGGPAALICLGSDKEWVLENLGKLQAKFTARPVKPDQYPSILEELKEFHNKAKKYPRNVDRDILFIYQVSLAHLVEKDFLELMAYHCDFFLLDERQQFFEGDSARAQLLMKIVPKVTTTGLETGVLNFVYWFNHLYKDYEGEIPASFTLYVPSETQDGDKISAAEIEQVIEDFYDKIVSRIADGFSIFKAEGKWKLDDEMQTEDVQLATVDVALEKAEIFATTLLLIVQAMDVQVQLNQDAVMIKVLNFPFFIGD